MPGKRNRRKKNHFVTNFLDLTNLHPLTMSPSFKLRNIRKALDEDVHRITRFGILMAMKFTQP